MNVNIDIPQSQISELNKLATQTGRGTDELLREAVSKMLAYNDWFKAQVQAGVDQIQRCEFIEEEEMDARVERALATADY